MKLFLYGNSGGIGGVIEEISNNHKIYMEEISNNHKTYDTLYGAYSSLVEDNGRGFAIGDLSCRYYAYDDRLDKQVYIICTDRYFNEVYSSPQFVSFMVELD